MNDAISFRARARASTLVRLAHWATAGVAGVVMAATPAAFAHPTDDELREAWQDRKRCEAETAWPDRVDPARLGISRTELRASVQALQRSPAQAALSPAAIMNLPLRLTRQASGSLASVEYELWQDAVYRIRWRLNDAFERPVLDELVRRGRTCFGPPEYDQTFKAEPTSPAATLRRIGWIHGDRRIELRQLHPLRGGPVYLSVADAPAMRRLGLAGLAPFPDPTQSAPWWRRSMAPLEPVTTEEQQRLGLEFLGLLAQLDH